MLLRTTMFWPDCERSVIDQTPTISWQVINFASSQSVDRAFS